MSSLRTSFISGVLYTGAAKYIGIIVGIVITAILARLISPEDFGVIAIATVFINFFSTLTTVGISPAVVQNKTITEDELRSINSFTFIIAGVITLLYICSIPLIINIYDGNEILSNIMLLLSVNVFFSVAATIPNAMILKTKMFKFIAIRTIVIQIVLGIISVAAALLGAGIYALMINPIGSSIILFVVNFKKFPIGFARLSKSATNKILSFSVFQMLFNLVYLGYRNIDKLIVGNYFGLKSLGYYEKSYRLMLMPIENISSVTSPVLHPLLSEYQNDRNKIWNTYVLMIETLAEFSFILSVALYFLADAIITIMYGDQWLSAIPVFKILALSTAFQLLQIPIGAVLQSINKVKGLFYSSLILFGFVCLTSVGAVWLNEFLYIAVGLDIAFICGFIVYQFFVSKYFEKTITEILSKIIRPLCIGIGMFAICYVCKMFVPMDNVWLQLCFYSTFTLIVTLILMKTGNMDNTLNLVKSFTKKMRKS